MVLIYKSLNSLITTHQTLLWVIKKSMQTSSNMYLTWMNSQNAHNLPLVSAGGVHLEPMGLYSHQIKDLKDLPKGAKIAIPKRP